MSNLRNLLKKLQLIESSSVQNIAEVGPLAAAAARALAAKVAARTAAKKSADQAAKKAGTTPAGTTATPQPPAGKEGVPLTDFGTVGAARTARQQAELPQVFRPTPRGPETGPIPSDIKRGLDLAAAARARDKAALQKAETEKMQQAFPITSTATKSPESGVPGPTSPVKFQTRQQRTQQRTQQDQTDLGKIVPGKRAEGPPELDPQLNKKAFRRSVAGHTAVGLGLVGGQQLSKTDRGTPGDSSTTGQGQPTTVDLPPELTQSAATDEPTTPSEISTDARRTTVATSDTDTDQAQDSQPGQGKVGARGTGAGGEQNWPPRPLEYIRRELDLKESLLQEYMKFLNEKNIK